MYGSTPANTYIRGHRQSENSRKHAREMARQLDKTIEKRDQQSNDKQTKADSERAAGSTARGKQSKRQHDVATRKVIKKRYLDETTRKDNEER